jgi:tetratricopeptide (TPR) repeat protein
MSRLALLLLSLVLLAACAGPPVQERPPLAQRVIDLGREGQQAFSKGDLKRAHGFFTLALRDAKRIEDSEGVAAMAINLARVARDSGASGEGLAGLAGVTEWHRSRISARLDQEIDLLSAVLLADLGRVDESLTRLDALRRKCSGDCALSVGADSLQARLILTKGDAASALALATATLDRAQVQGNRVELANLLRTRGEACLALGDFLTAKQALEEALDIDKALALPAKIVLDLESLTHTALAAGDTAAYAHYLSRLNEVRGAQANGASR